MKIEKLKPSDNPMNAIMYKMDECIITVAREELDGRLRHHLSIYHPTREPTWKEVKYARYKLLTDKVTMALILPADKTPINLHRHCFHLWEI